VSTNNVAATLIFPLYVGLANGLAVNILPLVKAKFFRFKRAMAAGQSEGSFL